MHQSITFGVGALAHEAVFPQTLVQTCIVHLIRYSLSFASWKERKTIVTALKPLYNAIDANAARAQFAIKFEERFTIKG